MARSNDIPPETILRAQAGDRNALEAILQAYQSTLLRMAYKLRHNWSEIEPLVNAGRMGIVEAIRKYRKGYRAAFWTFAYRYVRREMIDDLAKQLGLSQDARAAYPQIRRAYLDLQQRLRRAPTLDEIVRASGVTRGSVEQIVRVLFQAIASLDALFEQNPDGILPMTVDLPGYTQSPEDIVIQIDDAAARKEKIQGFCVACLGPVEAARFLVMTILREGNGGYHYDWEWIAASLQSIGEPPSLYWERTIEAEFSSWTCVPCAWVAVQQLFLCRNPHPTAASLRQRYSQALRHLMQCGSSEMLADGLE